LIAITAFAVTYTDSGVGSTTTERNSVKTDQKIVMTFPCPIRIYDPSMAGEVSKTPLAFKGFWFHTTPVKKKICSSGWNPECLKSTIYGTAVFLSRKKWDLGGDLLASCFDHNVPIDRETSKNLLRDPQVIGCVLALQANEVRSCFPWGNAADGHTETHLIEYLNVNVPLDESGAQGIRRINGNGNSSTSRQFGMSPGLGKSRQNKRIADFFLTNGIKAISFIERDTEVVAVYDPSCICVLSEATNLDVHPFPEFLASS
jgi:hypothetical protein